MLDRLFKPLAKELTAEVIEGDKVEIEYTQADVVRGNHIKIGPGCKVDLVEYKGEFGQYQQLYHLKLGRLGRLLKRLYVVDPQVLQSDPFLNHM